MNQRIKDHSLTKNTTEEEDNPNTKTTLKNARRTRKTKKKLTRPNTTQSNLRESTPRIPTKYEEADVPILKANEIQEGGELRLALIDYHPEVPFLDISFTSDSVFLGCGEFGLNEYEIDNQGGIVNEYNLLGDQVVLDVQQDFMGRIIFTNPDESSILMVQDEEVIFVSKFIISMAGLNIRLNKSGTRLFFQNRNNYIANLNLEETTFEVERVYTIKELKDLVKFEADAVGSDIVAMAQDGTLKVSSKNQCYKLATDKNQKFSSFSTSQDEKYLVASGTTKNEETGDNLSTLQSWRTSKGGVLKKEAEIQILTFWKGDGYDVMIDIAISGLRTDGYHLSVASLNTGNFFVINLKKNSMTLLNKLSLRTNDIPTLFLKYYKEKFWSSGDDGIMNCITYAENLKLEE